jgi:hypothetical protein
MSLTRQILVKLQISKSIAKPGIPTEVLKTMLVVDLADKGQCIKNLLSLVTSQVGLFLDKSILFSNLYLCTSDGFMLPPNMPLEALVYKREDGKMEFEGVLKLSAIACQKKSEFGLFGQKIKVSEVLG